MKKTVILTEMFLDVATPREKAKFEELYAKSNKGSATVLALRVVKDHWDLMLNKQEKKSITPLSDSSGQERFIRFSENGRQWLEKS